MASIKYYLVIILTIKVIDTHFRKFGKDFLKRKILPSIKFQLETTLLLLVMYPSKVFTYTSTYSFIHSFTRHLLNTYYVSKRSLDAADQDM